jgi:hypothetical protein
MIITYISIAANLKKVTKVGFKVHNSKNSGGNKASYKMKILQGDVECTTKEHTWYNPKDGGTYYQNGDFGCRALFDPKKPVQLSLLTSSSDWLWIDDIGVDIGGVALRKIFKPYSAPIYSGRNAGPHTVANPYIHANPYTA